MGASCVMDLVDAAEARCSRRIMPHPIMGWGIIRRLNPASAASTNSIEILASSRNTKSSVSRNCSIHLRVYHVLCLQIFHSIHLRVYHVFIQKALSTDIYGIALFHLRVYHVRAMVLADVPMARLGTRLRVQHHVSGISNNICIY